MPRHNHSASLSYQHLMYENQCLSTKCNELMKMVKTLQNDMECLNSFIMSRYDVSGANVTCVMTDACGNFIPCLHTDASGNMIPCVLTSQMPPQNTIVMDLSGRCIPDASGRCFPYYPYYPYYSSYGSYYPFLGDDDYMYRDFDVSEMEHQSNPPQRIIPQPYYPTIPVHPPNPPHTTPTRSPVPTPQPHFPVYPAPLPRPPEPQFLYPSKPKEMIWPYPKPYPYPYPHPHPQPHPHPHPHPRPHPRPRPRPHPHPHPYHHTPYYW